jgi:dihydroorotate dehydrogenase (fumarate)
MAEMPPEAPPALEISPPLINSASPWATTLEDLRALYSCPYTGAVTTRTSLVRGFDHDPNKHSYVFFDAGTRTLWNGSTPNASLNSLGYSPFPLDGYIEFIRKIAQEQPAPGLYTKRFIISVTGTPEEVVESYYVIVHALALYKLPVAMEINLSCPNIPNKPPPAYSKEALVEYLVKVETVAQNCHRIRIPVGIKTPPYTHSTEYEMLMDALEESAAATGVCPLSFITATNTLGSCMVLSGQASESTGRGGLLESAYLPPTCGGIGGMAGAPLHPLALGNVSTLRRMLDDPRRKSKVGHIRIIGVGGVLDQQGYQRMRLAGADVVGVATGLGLKGVAIFKELISEPKK